MKTVERRLDRLEDRLAPQSRKQFLIILTDAAQKLALDSGRCVQILCDAGHLDTTSLSCVVDLGFIPDGLNAAELRSTFGSTAPAPGARESYRNTDSDIAA
jgi:hypothetical protein